MPKRTYRYLESKLRIGALGMMQWLQLFIACLMLYGMVKLFGLTFKMALPIAVFFIGIPTALAMISDDFEFGLSGRVRDSMTWIFGGRYFAADPDAPLDTTARRIGSTAGLHDVVAISPDGLLLRGNGTFVRALEVGSFNPIVLDDEEGAQLSDSLHNIVAQVESGQSIQFLVEGRPLALGSVIDEGRRAAQAAIDDCQQAGESERAAALARLTVTSEQSITLHSANNAAMELRHFVLIPCDPLINAISRRLPLLKNRTPQLDEEGFEFALEQTAGLSDAVIKGVQSQRLDAKPLSGSEYAALIARHASGVETTPDELAPFLTPLYTVDDVNAALRAAETPISRALAPRDLDFRDITRVRVDQTLSQTTYLAEIPESTWFGQPLQLMQLGQSFTYSTFITATDRVRERRSYRRRFQRIRGLNQSRQQRGKFVSIEAELQQDEAQDVVADLTTTIGSGIYEVSNYINVRVPDGDKAQQTLKQNIKTIRREATSSDDARYGDGAFAQKNLFVSTLPLADDRAGRTKRFVARNVGDLIPLVGSSCGSPTGIVIGHSTPGRSLERIDPFDPVHENHLVLISGKSGGGKTMAAIIMLSRWLARGARGFIIDRAGHYDFLSSLIPGAAKLEIGPGDGRFSINPWDVANPKNVPAEKISFLLDLHALLIGNDGADGVKHLDALETSVLETAIRKVYLAAANDGLPATESTLRAILLSTAKDSDDIVDHAARSLAWRLDQFVDDGSYAYLLDTPTNVPEDSPLTVFDTQAIPDGKIGAAILLISEFVMRHVKARRQEFLDGNGGVSEWSGRAFLLCDETWAILQSPITARWFNELARRSRHLALALVAISQQMDDFSGEYGTAFRRQSTIQLYFKQSTEDLKFATETQAFTSAEAELLSGLSTVKRDYSSAFLVNGIRGNGVITMRYGPLEYWIASNDPNRDEPLRRLALRQSGDNPWGALQLLADPTWLSDNERHAVVGV